MARHQQPTPAQRQDQNQPKHCNKDVSFEERRVRVHVVEIAFRESIVIAPTPIQTCIDGYTLTEVEPERREKRDEREDEKDSCAPRASFHGCGRNDVCHAGDLPATRVVRVLFAYWLHGIGTIHTMVSHLAARGALKQTTHHL